MFFFRLEKVQCYITEDITVYHSGSSAWRPQHSFHLKGPFCEIRKRRREVTVTKTFFFRSYQAFHIFQRQSEMIVPNVPTSSDGVYSIHHYVKRLSVTCNRSMVLSGYFIKLTTTIQLKYC